MSKDTKTILKEARELLKQKEFNTTIKICKKVLKEDKRNYNALVLMGAAMREVKELKSQVPKTLKKATDIQPDNPLAWHGLLVHYEGEPNSIEICAELIPVYNKLLQLEKDTTKFILYLKNLSESLLQANDDKALSECIATLCKLKAKEETDVEKVKLINETIASVLTQYPKITNELDEILEQVLSILIQDENSINRHDYYKRYLKLLYKSEKFDKLISEAAKMYSIFNQDIYPLEWICRAYSEYVIIHDSSCKKIDIPMYYETLLDHDSESILGYFAKAVYLYQTRSLINARNILSHLVHVKPKWFHAWLLLGKIDISLYCWEDAETAALHAEKLIPEGDPQNLRHVINLLLLEALIKSSNKLKWMKAESKFEELSDGSVKSSILRAHLYVLLRDKRAKVLINNLKNDQNTKIEGTVLHAMDLLQERHLEEAADVLGSILETSEAWLTLGKIHWEMADYGHSLMAFLKGIRADPNNWECLVYLGRYHQEHSKDYDRSKKCYQKALQINPNSEQAGIGLSLVHRLLKNNEENLKLLTQLTNQGRGPKWALLQLGLQYLDQGNSSEAVAILRNAVKADPIDSNCWECLADAYLARGAHLSAIKSYERALKLNSESIYSMTQLSNIKLLVGEKALAKEDFLKILEKNERNVTALKGLAECCLRLGQDYAKAQLLARARENFQEAVDNATIAIKEKSTFLCNWKLLGDICYNVAALPEKYCYLTVVPELVQSDSKNFNITITQKDILLLASRCYCRALSMSKNSPLLWHDLSRCYFAQLHLDTSIDPNEIANKSLAAAKEAVKIDPSNWFHWNLLGVICMSNEIKNYALAQHSFVMAIETEPNNAVSWTNLGCLYLLLEDLYRANKAFSWGQKIDPAYINCWIGQALIAEQVSQNDAMDLFRHATQLGYHHEAAVGYTHWVIKTIMDSRAKQDPLYTYVIENMHAVTVASDGIQWYTVHYPNDPYALNAYGLLLERQKLYKPATERFSTALEFIKDNKHKDLLSINLARVLVQQEHYEEAVKICLSIKEASFASHCQLAISLFKAEHFKESYEAYKAAVEWLADSDSDKAHVLCAMASMAYMTQESTAAKTLLFQAVEIKPPIISGYLALAALGMLDGDKHLTDLVLKDLKTHDNNSEYRNHIVKLMAYSCLIQNDREGASKVFRQYIHCYPDSSELWSDLGKILLTISDDSFYKCVEKALFLSENLSSEHIAKIICMSSLSKLITSSPNKGLRAVLNTVHSYPANVDSWSNLITALLPRWAKISQQNAHWLMVLASRVRNNLSCTRSMEQWLLKNEKQANDIAYC
ncbi:tetratricopeptide repeat domain 37 isoform X1 [Nasonia vitripennis]|uniref:Tetratricopeptide repeat protein 37 n=1 Tax=Nasonia vitripennis TaxID=7425 RepID=A0A7M6UF77_NASVI|nr:tetratricopeptide repeat domain 37 [Nasonia vitripennis]XP_031787438.1 tetratricopeptide repeat domain 37 isoform X1 [Nasonia vitripennis]